MSPLGVAVYVALAALGWVVIYLGTRRVGVSMTNAGLHPVFVVILVLVAGLVMLLGGWVIYGAYLMGAVGFRTLGKKGPMRSAPA